MQTEQLSTVNILNLFETSKRERETFVDDLISRIEEGQAEALRVHLQAKCMESILKDLLASDKYREFVLSEAEKNGKKFSYHNSEFSIKEVGTKYDYSQCGDIHLAEMQAELDTLSEKIKTRQKFLQMADGKGIDMVSNDGEVYKIYPPSKSSTTSVAVTLK
jgi:elongation factor P--beta-lysine ligase